jgi:hypothetical protein
VEENIHKSGFEVLLKEGMRRAMKKMLEYKVRNDGELVFSDSKGGVLIIRARDYIKTEEYFKALKKLK